MATNNPTISLATAYPLPDSSNTLPSVSYIGDAITNLVIGDFTRYNIKEGEASLITISGSQPGNPTTGEFWLDTSVTPQQLKRYDGGGWIGVGVHIDSSAPSDSEGQGMIWYDTTLRLTRVWDTIQNVTGWHPLSASYQLQTNVSGSQINQYAVVVKGGTGSRPITTTTTAKDVTVIGVAQEDIADGATGVVAVVGGGAYTSILVDNGDADGAIAQGDGIVTYTTAGECRTVGPLEVQGFTAADHGRAWGVPLGCFAIASSAKFTDANSDIVVFARLLGSVGEGRTVMGARATVDASVTTGSWQESQVAYFDASHAPMIGAYFSFVGTYDDGAAEADVTETFQLSVNQNAWVSESVAGRCRSDGIIQLDSAMVFCPTSSGAPSYDALGNYVSANLTNDSGGSWTGAALYSHGYVY